MPPALTEGLRAHLTRIQDTGLTNHARQRALLRFTQEIQRSRINLNPHLGRALDTSLTLHAREKGLHRLLQDPLQLKTDLEVETLRALCQPIQGEESLAQLAREIISKRTPPADDGLTVRVLPKVPPALAPRIDDLKDLRELQGLITQQPQIKERAVKFAEALAILLPLREWGEPITRAIDDLKGMYNADLAVAERAAKLDGKGLAGAKFFDLPPLPLTGDYALAPKRDWGVLINELNYLLGEIERISSRFVNLKQRLEEYAREKAKGEADIVEMENQLGIIRFLAEALDTELWARFEKRIVIDNRIKLDFDQLEDGLFKIGQEAKKIAGIFALTKNEIDQARDQLYGIIVQLERHADLPNVTEALRFLRGIDYQGQANKLIEFSRDYFLFTRKLVEAVNVPVELGRRVQPPAPTPPAPPKPVNPLEVALEESKCLVFNITGKTGGARPAEVSLLEKLLWMAPHGIEEQDRNRAMDIADIALSVRNKLAVALPEVADLAKQIQRRMEKYLATTHKLFVLEPTLGTQQPRVHDKVEVVGDETGKFGEILRVTSLGYIDADGKLVRKAKVIIGDGTVFTSKSFDTAGPARPESWSRVPPPDVPAGPAPVPPPMPLPSTPPAPNISLGVRAMDLAKRVGRRIWKRWLKINGAVYRFQTRVVKLAVRAAKGVNSFVIKTFGPVADWFIDGLAGFIKDRITLPEIMRIDIYFNKDKWESGDAKLIRRFRKTSLVNHLKTEAGETVAEIHKFGSTYKLRTVAGQKVEIEGHEFAGVIPIKSGTVIKIGERKFLIDIQPARRSFRRGRGVVQIAGGENGKVAVKNAYLLTDRAGRLSNEDAVGHARISDDLELFVEADGMGGHQAGEIASRMVIEIVISEVKEGASLEKAIEKASQLIYELSQSHPRFRGMGSTLVATLIDRKAKKMRTAWVGDSRARYIPHDPAMEAQILTRDQKLIWVAEEPGIKPLAEQLPIGVSRMEQIEAVQNSPKWRASDNVITNTVGHKEKLEIHLVEAPLIPGPEQGILVLASDGLTAGLSEKQIAELVRQGGSLEEIAKRLVEAALKGGTRDNVSVVLIRVPALDLTQLKEQVFEHN